ncbi:RDD family protein [Actinomyces marmotae]|uniref:FHA domain-containing protein n=1 Tax=Actinomyces marmotae TaxID=2737173 RepID=A0A6M8B085_9ACTO|nr:RDD family protein [Actinomyces marmotae]QKD80319.1 FHA domain-containing protein [Actinomyces marmotae]
MTATTTQAPKRDQRQAAPGPALPASPKARLLAVIIDILLGLVIGTIITLLAKGALGFLITAGVTAVGLLLARFALIATTGWTPGGRIAGVRMVDASNDNPSLVGAFVHTDLILITAGLGGLFMLRSAARDPEGMGWHDRLSRMRLISTKHSSSFAPPGGVSGPCSAPSGLAASPTSSPADEPTAMMTPSAVPSVEHLAGATGETLAAPSPTTPSAVPSVPAASSSAAGTGSDPASRLRHSIRHPMRRPHERSSSRAQEPGAVAILGSIPWSGEAPELDSPTLDGSGLDALNAGLVVGSVAPAPDGGATGPVIDAETPEADSAPAEAPALTTTSAPVTRAPSASMASAASAPIAPRVGRGHGAPPPTEPVDLRHMDLGAHSDGEDSLDSTVQSIRMPSAIEDTGATATLVPERDGGEIALAGVVVLGRDPVTSPEHPEASLLVLRGTSLSISKTHALLIPVVDGLWVTDLHSTNGTTIVHGGTSRRAVPGIPEPVFPGDRVLFGKVGYRVKD